MDTPLITMDADAAKAKLAAYRDRKVKDAQAEYDTCTKCFEHLAAGRALIDINQAIAAGGFDAMKRPKLAICRADRQVVRMNWQSRSTRILFEGNWQPNGQSTQMRKRDLFLTADVGQEHGRTFQHQNQTWGVTIDGWAKVPLVPADVRPARGALESWHILWEVERWYERAPLVQPSRDPYLLKHLEGSLYAVLAEWNLTDLELAVMRQLQQ